MNQLPLPCLIAVSVLGSLGCSGDKQGATVRPDSTAAHRTRASAPWAGQPLVVPNRYFVLLKPQAFPAGVASVARQVVQNAKVPATVIEYSYKTPSFQAFSATLTPTQIAALKQSQSVDSIYPVPMARLYNNGSTVDEPNVTWGIDRIDQVNAPLDHLYTYHSTGKGVHVYIIDTGIRTDNAEFGGRAVVDTDLFRASDHGVDCNGHGTHVAGTVGGVKYGVAKDVSIHAIRVFGCSGGAGYDVIGAAVELIATHHQNPAVINMSIGGPPDAGIDSIIGFAVARGVTVVVAAGNENDDACYHSPARASTAITVGATDINDRRAIFDYGGSNFGQCVKVYAPGADILSAGIGSQTDSAVMSGTSMATPHVTGVVAQFLENHSHATPREVRDSLLAAATFPIDNEGAPAGLLYAKF